MVSAAGAGGGVLVLLARYRLPWLLQRLSRGKTTLLGGGMSGSAMEEEGCECRKQVGSKRQISTLLELARRVSA